MLEVLIALVVLGIIAMLFAQTSRISQRTAGKSVDWVQEGVAIEKTVENLRIGHGLEDLRNMDSSWTDHSASFPIQMSTKGEVPNIVDYGAIPVERLAVVTISARRTSYQDSVVVKSILWVP